MLKSTVDPEIFFFSSRRRHTRFDCDWSSDVCSSDLQTGAEINVDDNGLITISAVGEGGERARDIIASMVQVPEVGKVYEGVVKSTTAFGAFVEILPGVEGLLHISELQHGRTERTEDVVKKGDQVRVK